MARPTVRRRSRDGLVEIVPSGLGSAGGDRLTPILGLVLLTTGLYLATLLSAHEVLLALVCCAAVKFALVVRATGLPQPPDAPVLALETGRRPERQESR
jgi:hypothetical protein